MGDNDSNMEQQQPGGADLNGPMLRLGTPLSRLRATAHNGPGWRIDIWLQGCSIRCTDRCLNPRFLSPSGGHLYPVDQVAAALINTARQEYRQVEGITVLGGEPTDQAPALALLLRSIRGAGLSTMVYTGHTLQHLRGLEDPHMDAMLAATDILVDGPFVAELYDEHLAWRGSANQGLHCLSGRHTPAQLQEAFDSKGKCFSIRIEPYSLVSVSGLQETSGIDDVESRLRELNLSSGRGKSDG